MIVYAFVRGLARATIEPAPGDTDFCGGWHRVLVPPTWALTSRCPPRSRLLLHFHTDNITTAAPTFSSVCGSSGPDHTASPGSLHRRHPSYPADIPPLIAPHHIALRQQV